METEAPVYERIVLKLSGEAVQERGGRDNISPAVVREIAERIKEVRDLGVQVAVVIGGGNIWRGLSAADRGMDRSFPKSHPSGTPQSVGQPGTASGFLSRQWSCGFHLEKFIVTCM